MTNNFTIKANDNLAVITLPDRSFGALGDAIAQISKIYGDKKILMMQSVDKKDQTFKVVIVWEF